MLSYANIHALNLAYDFPWFRRWLNASEATICDGHGLRLAGYLVGAQIEHRNTPPDFVELVCQVASKEGIRLYMLGGRPGVAEKAATKMQERYPDLKISFHHGYFDKCGDSAETKAVIDQVNAFRTDILFVGFGMPAQEKWIAENRAHIDAAMFMPVGAMFDYLSGARRRAPRWMTDHGLEWLGRLSIEPGRLWRRYILGIPLFFWRLALHHFLKLPLPEE